MSGDSKLPSIKSWPASQVERRKVKDLVPYAKNARTHSEEQVGQIARSIQQFGFTVPVLVDPDGGIIAGHGPRPRREAIESVRHPCDGGDGLTRRSEPM